MGANTIVVEEKEEDSFSVKQVTNRDKKIADSHVRPDHHTQGTARSKARSECSLER
jgi:hypothetical protein